ncbi:MAG: P-loop NTPase [Xenococcaceae cyanobacterium MO_167.B27]|nr:P-loop NTPase [Xenococcaceae cyanobacterium MO_167.B27]
MKRIASIITRHWKPLLAFNLLVISFTIVKIKSSSKIWEANAQLIMPERTGNLNANLGTLGSLNSGDTFSSQVNPLIAQESILTSDVLMQQVLASDPEKEEFPSLRSYKNLFQVEIADKSTTIDLTVSASSPELAQERAEKWIEIYQQRLNQLRKEDSEARINFSQKELEQTKQELEDAQRKLAQFEQASGLVDSDEQTSGIIQLIHQLSAAKYEAQVNAEANWKKVQALSARLGLTPSQAISSVSLSENQNYQSIKQKLIEVDIELGQLTTIRTDADPQVQELRLQRDQLRNQLKQYVQQGVAEAKIDTTVANNAGRTNLIQELILAETEAQAQTKEAEKLGNELEKLQGTLTTIPVNKNILQNLQKEKDVAEGVYQGLIAKLQQAKIDAFNTFAHVQVLEPPLADPKPVEPKIMLIQLNAFFAAVVGSMALVKLLEKRNPLLSAKDLEFYDFPVLGCINNFQYFGRSLKTSDFWLNLVSQPNTQIELDFQRLASAVSLQPLKNRRLLVTSAIRGEGKTTVTIGLAKALADLGYRVLMVDGDFYRAELTNSLTPITEEEVTEKPIQLASNLYLQTTWQKQVGNAALVKQGKFDQHLGMAELNEEYDYIVIDTPPVSLTSETALMATTISNLLYVVRPNISERNSVFSSFEQLHQHNAKILGLVINGVENSSRPYSKGYLEPVKTEVLSQKSHN